MPTREFLVLFVFHQVFFVNHRLVLFQLNQHIFGVIWLVLSCKWLPLKEMAPTLIPLQQQTRIFKGQTENILTSIPNRDDSFFYKFLF
jgi:hypothetical protein